MKSTNAWLKKPWRNSAGRYIVRGGKMAIVEGEWKPTRIVVLEFGSFDGAVEWWGSQEYAAAKALRQSLSKTDIVIVDGYDGAHG